MLGVVVHKNNLHTQEQKTRVLLADGQSGIYSKLYPQRQHKIKYETIFQMCDFAEEVQTEWCLNMIFWVKQPILNLGCFFMVLG